MEAKICLNSDALRTAKDMTNPPKNNDAMPSGVYYEPVDGRKPKPHEKVVLCFERIATAALAAEKQPVDLEALKRESTRWMLANANHMDLEDVGNAIIDHLYASGHLAPDLASVKEALDVPALMDEKQGVEVTEATAMRVLWDAGYKIHGQFGWVQDGRKEFDEKLNSLYAKSVEGK